MLKLKMIINVLLLLTISLCLHPVDTLIAGTCDETESSGSPSTFTGDHIYIDNWFPKIQFDPSIPEEMAPNSSIPLTVSGGCAPYTHGQLAETTLAWQRVRQQDYQTHYMLMIRPVVLQPLS